MWPFRARQAPPPARLDPGFKPSEKKPRRLDFSYGNHSIARADQARAYELPEPPPGVLPTNAPKMAQDQSIGPLCNWATQQGNGNYGVYGPTFPGYTILAELAQRPEFRRGSDVYAEEMTRRWIRLQSRGDAKSERITLLHQEMEKFHVRAVFRESLTHDGYFGRGHVFIDLNVSDEELTMPLLADKAKIKKGSLKGLRTVEPIWTYPAAYNSTAPLRADFYKPTVWYVMGKAVHSTRLLTIVGREVSDILKPAFMFGGLSRTMMAYEYVGNFLRTRQSVSDLLHSFSITVFKTNLETLLNAGSAGSLWQRVQEFIGYRDNQGVFVADKDQEDIANVATPLGGLDALQAQAYDQIASVLAMPLVKYAGTTPSGLNASSDGEIRAFYDSIAADQEKLLRKPLSFVLDVLQVNAFGEIDQDITFSFEPLWQLNETEFATVQKTKADTHAVYQESNVVSPEEVREALAADEQSPYHGLDLSSPPPEPASDPADDPEMAEALRGSDPHTEHASGDS